MSAKYGSHYGGYTVRVTAIPRCHNVPIIAIAGFERICGIK